MRKQGSEATKDPLPIQNATPANQAALLQQPGIGLGQGELTIGAQQQQGVAEAGDGSEALTGDSSSQATQGQGPNHPAPDLS